MGKFFILLTAIHLLWPKFSAAGSLPTVDLDYAIYEPSVVKAPVSGNTYYNFTNVRFAAPPVDSLRFAAPQPPLNNRSAGAQDGAYGNICPQAFPSWLITALTVNKVEYYNGTGAGQTESEDCLFLDVVVPEKVYKHGQEGNGLNPVLIWLYGGGWVSGDKRSLTDPIGLLESAEQELIFVAPNYRLGAFGFLAGPTFLSQGGTPNNGLLDQKAAIEWTQQYIHVFGGDPSKITVMGESAGAGSILYHLAALESGAYGVGANRPFEQVITQSPVILPHTEEETEDKFTEFLALLDVETLEQARNLSSEKLMQANREIVENTYYASYDLGPAVSGDYITGWPTSQLALLDTNVTALVGRNSHEGKLFVDPKIKSNADFTAYVSKKVLSFLSNGQIEHVVNILYPPVYDGSQPYTDVQGRLALLIQEAFINCNAHLLAKHAGGESFGYIFDVSPGLHGQDIAYSFYTPGLPAPFIADKDVATEMQGYLTRFARTGNTNGGNGRVKIPEYRQGEVVLDIKLDGFQLVKDDAANSRCAWWTENY